MSQEEALKLVEETPAVAAPAERPELSMTELLAMRDKYFLALGQHNYQILVSKSYADMTAKHISEVNQRLVKLENEGAEMKAQAQAMKSEGV